MEASLEVYIASDFDAVNYARSIVSREENVEECLSKIKQHRVDIDKALSEYVAENNEELMKRLNSSEELRSDIRNNKDHANALSASLGRLWRDVSDPFAQMKKDANKLRNIQRACKVLDRTRRFLRSVDKLKGLLTGKEGQAVHFPNSGRELAKAAQILNDVEFLLRGGDLDGITIVEAERSWLAMVSKGVRSKTETVLHKAITDLNQSEIGSALQAFFNLGVLPERIDGAIGWVVANISEEAKQVFDAHALSEAVEEHKLAAANGGAANQDKKSTKKRVTKASNRIKPPSGEEKLWKSVLWERVEGLEAGIRTWSLRVWNLQRVLFKKRDPITHVCFADQVIMASSSESSSNNNNEASKQKLQSVYEKYWRSMTQALHGQVETGCRAYPFIRNGLGVQGYPKLRSLFRALPQKLAQRTAGKSVASIGNSPEETYAILRSLQPLLEIFLAQSHHRLKETVELMFPEVESLTSLLNKQNALPTRNDVNTFAQTIGKELAASKGDPDLYAVLARGAANSVNLFASKAEDIIVMDDQAFVFRFQETEEDVSFERTPAQVHNMSVLSLALKLESLIEQQQQQQTKVPALKDAISRLNTLTELIVGEYLNGAARELNRVLSKIHQQSFRGGTGDESIYISRFNQAVEILCKYHLDKLPKEYGIVNKFRKLLQAKVISMFVRHVCLVRPLDDQGRLQLTNDLAQFELAVGSLSSNNWKLSDLGDAYVELRGLRQLLFIADDQDQEKKLNMYKALLENTLRVTNVWHSIFADAPPELRSPTSGEELAYCEWLDKVEAESEQSNSDSIKLRVGTTLTEPQALKDQVKAKIASSLDKYIQMLSARKENKTCPQYELLYRLIKS